MQTTTHFELSRLRSQTRVTVARRVLATLTKAARHLHERRVMRRALVNLEDHMLRDIGLSRADLMRDADAVVAERARHMATARGFDPKATLGRSS